MKSKRIYIPLLLVLTILVSVLGIWLLFNSGLRMETVSSIEVECGESITAYELVEKINRHDDIELTLAGKGSLTDDNRCISFEQAGSYTVLIKAKTSAHYVESQTTVRVRDNDPPAISAKDFTIVVGDTPDYLAHVSAKDKQDGDISQNIRIDSSKIKLDTPGRYEVGYSVNDQGGNISTTTGWLTIRRAPASAITLSDSNLWLCVNEFEQMEAYVEPEDWDGKLEWSSSDPEICSVVDGFLYARDVGTVTITAQADGVTEECTVYCEYPEITTVWLNQRLLELDERQTAKLSCKTYPSNWGGDVEWSSSDPSIATVEDGLVTWKRRGSCTITVYADGVSDSCSVTCGGKTITDNLFDIFGGGFFGGHHDTLGLDVSPD